jgi:hypothetical protein
MDLSDVTPERFFDKVTFLSSSETGKIKIPDGEFFQCAIMLKLIREIELLRGSK